MTDSAAAAQQQFSRVNRGRRPLVTAGKWRAAARAGMLRAQPTILSLVGRMSRALLLASRPRCNRGNTAKRSPARAGVVVARIARQSRLSRKSARIPRHVWRGQHSRAAPAGRPTDGSSRMSHRRSVRGQGLAAR
eukprot:CAMPEP_0206532722 /NCGR_PEP_ID=MMETSP0325_2-20121206/4557_1 /ASSEMBLY_ACC=CAM_ASM_000347 /TAXON_ID=2866 /ORGANISM="Crypthecodinium cohnii, Strain Seligo" /LENGTH=134 /DNA_ID=CAMNT_0054029265 /DNA_START=345 /DNA_END=746 /DNA_ORIENTATION=-